MNAHRIADDYGGGEEMPLGGFAAILGAYSLATAVIASTVAATRRELPARVDVRDVLLFGAATHKLTRIVTKDWVTAPLRAPFTKYEGSAGSGEVKEKATGTGIRLAIGDLLTCPFCTGPWIAGALYATYLFDRRIARLAASLFATVAVSDWLHQGYAAAEKHASRK